MNQFIGSLSLTAKDVRGLEQNQHSKLSQLPPRWFKISAVFEPSHRQAPEFSEHPDVDTCQQTAP
jgi:hypothetical protein